MKGDRTRLFTIVPAFLCYMLTCVSQNLPQIQIDGNQNYCVGSAIAIVTNVDIDNPGGVGNTLNTVFIQISEGYEINQDLLYLNGNFSNITASWSVEQGLLSLSGPASLMEFEDAIASVFFETTQNEFTADRAFSINLSSANFLPSTGHYYMYVPDVGISWSQAKIAAENLQFFGIQGYLATITSEEEAQLSGAQSEGTGWIGASDAEQEGSWKWVTGPENGTLFWVGQSNGVPQNGEFSFWNTDEPNNFGATGEDYAHITDPSIGNLGSWNDLQDQGDAPGSPYHPQGYIVEFGGMPGDPKINLSASSTLNMPRLTANSSSVCANSMADLAVTSNTPRVLWFDTETSSAIIHEGITYSAKLTETTTFWLLPLYDDCSTGKRFPLTIEVFPVPEAKDVSIIQCDDEFQDGLSVFDLSDYKGLLTNGATNREIKFYLDAGLTNPIDSENFNNTSNPQTIFAEIIDTVNGCSAKSEIYLETNVSNLNDVVIEECDTQIENGLVQFDLSVASAQILDGLSTDFEIDYYLSYQDALFKDDALGNTYANVEPYEQTIYARVEEEGNCHSIIQVNLKIIKLPDLAADETLFYCLNSFPRPIELNSGMLSGVSHDYNYAWSTGETTKNIEVSAPGTYSVEVVAKNGCSKTRTITVLPSNTATVDDVSVSDLLEDNSITLEVSGSGEYEFSLNNESGPWQSENTFRHLSPGIYTVYVRDVKNNCGSVSKQVSVVGYPKFFTPNGDGDNDLWQLGGISEQFQPNSKVYIFDRYGKMLFTLHSYNQSWDGTFNGVPLPVNDYWFYAILADGRQFRGHFTLKR